MPGTVEIVAEAPRPTRVGVLTRHREDEEGTWTLLCTELAPDRSLYPFGPATMFVDGFNGIMSTPPGRVGLDAEGAPIAFCHSIDERSCKRDGARLTGLQRTRVEVHAFLPGVAEEPEPAIVEETVDCTFRPLKRMASPDGCASAPIGAHHDGAPWLVALALVWSRRDKRAPQAGTPAKG